MKVESKSRAKPNEPAPAPSGNRRSWRRRALFACLLLTAGFAATRVDDILVERGRANLRARRHLEALRCFEWAEWLAPNSAEVAFLLARTNRRLERFGEVRRYLAKADELKWDIHQLYREQWMALAQTSQFDEMEAHWADLFTDAADDGPEISNAYVTWSLSRLNVEEALEVIDAWEADFPEDAQPHFMRGRVYEVMLRWADAAQKYETALQLAPHRNEIRFRLGNALMHLLKNDEAAAHLQECLEVDAHDAEATVALAKCFYKMNEEARARELLTELIEREPNHVEALHALGDVELGAGRHEAAQAALKRAVDLKPEDQTIRYALVQALQRLGRKDDAAEHLRFVQEATKPLLRLANLTADLVEHPGDIELRFQIAEITWKYKSREEGAQWFRSLLDLQPNHSATHKALAEHYRLKGNSEKAE